MNKRAQKLGLIAIVLTLLVGCTNANPDSGGGDESNDLGKEISLEANYEMKTNEETSLEVLKEMLPILEAQEDYSNDALYEMLMKYVADKGCKNGYALWPIRTAVSGKQMTPAGATEIMEIIGKEETIYRVKKAIEMLSQ